MNFANFYRTIFTCKLIDLRMKRMYIVDVESHLKNSGATHGPEREFHERERSACSGLAHPGFPSLPTKLVFFIFS